MIYSVDSIDGNVITLIGDDDSRLVMRRNELALDLNEGDIVNIEGDSITIDREEADRRRKKNHDRLKRLFGE